MSRRPPLSLAVALALWGACGGEPEQAEFRTPPPPEPAPAPVETTTAARTTTPDTAAPRAAATGTVAASSLGAMIYAVQVGAFAQDANASRVIARIAEAGFPVWETSTQQGGRTLTRVRVGALTTTVDASRLGRLLEQRFGVPIWIAPVPADTRLPTGIADATRRLLGA